MSKNKLIINNEYEIVELTPNDMHKCSSFWNLNDSRLIERKTFAYKVNDEYIGGCALYERYEKCGHLSHFDVRKDLRGKGIGSRILEFAIKHLKETNMEIMRLHVLKDNVSAIKLYKRYGFNETDEIIPDRIVMIKML